MEFIQRIISSPLYGLLVGGGGIIAIIVAVLGLKGNKQTNKQNEMRVENSKKVQITDNEFNNQKVVVRNSEEATIQKNKG